MQHTRLSLATLAAAALLAGCGSTVKLDEGAPVESRSPGAGATGNGAGATGSGAGQGVATVTTGSAGSAAAGAARIVYFDFDSYVVKDEFRGVVDANAKRLAADGKRRVVVEGHADERGGREYNLALGQKRAEAVTKAMNLLGAKEAQMEAVSFGKERPAVDGHDEAAWSKNRRAEIKDR